ncbi:MAG: hypothetical protein OHK0012_14720 [Synechococcales cyanobacterium]
MLHPIPHFTSANPALGSSLTPGPALGLLLSQLSAQNPFRCRRALHALAGIPHSLSEAVVLEKLLTLIMQSQDDLLVRQGLMLLHRLNPIQVAAPVWTQVTDTLRWHLPQMTNTLNACLALRLLCPSPQPLYAWGSQHISLASSTWRVLHCTTDHAHVIYGHLWSGMTTEDYLDVVLPLGDEPVKMSLHRQGSLYTYPHSP